MFFLLLLLFFHPTDVLMSLTRQNYEFIFNCLQLESIVTCHSSGQEKHFSLFEAARSKQD